MNGTKQIGPVEADFRRQLDAYRGTLVDHEKTAQKMREAESQILAARDGEARLQTLRAQRADMLADAVIANASPIEHSGLERQITEAERAMKPLRDQAEVAEAVISKLQTQLQKQQLQITESRAVLTRLRYQVLRERLETYGQQYRAACDAFLASYIELAALAQAANGASGEGRVGEGIGGTLPRHFQFPAPTSLQAFADFMQARSIDAPANKRANEFLAQLQNLIDSAARATQAA